MDGYYYTIMDQHDRVEFYFFDQDGYYIYGADYLPVKRTFDSKLDTVRVIDSLVISYAKSNNEVEVESSFFSGVYNVMGDSIILQSWNTNFGGFWPHKSGYTIGGKVLGNELYFISCRDERGIWDSPRLETCELKLQFRESMLRMKPESYFKTDKKLKKYADKRRKEKHNGVFPLTD